MRYSLSALISLLAFLTATTAAQAVSPAVLHQGPATAAVPVPAVEKQPLAPPEGMQAAPPQPVFVREVTEDVPPLQQIQAKAAGQQEAQSRRAKLLKAALKAKEQEILTIKVEPAAALAGIAPAAGGAEFSAVAVKKNPPLPAAESPKLSHINAFVDKIMAQHAPREEKDNTVSADYAAAAVTLEELLNGAGMALNSFVPPESTAGGVVAQWASGKISGLYERVASQGDFSSQVSTYIGRYAQDCSTGMQVLISPVKAGRAGATATADVECVRPANGYTAAFVFLKDSNGFSVLQHATVPAGKEKVRSVRDAIAQKLEASQGFAAPQAIALSVVAPPLKLNIPAVEPAPLGARAMDGLATIIIQ